MHLCRGLLDTEGVEGDMNPEWWEEFITIYWPPIVIADSWAIDQQVPEEL